MRAVSHLVLSTAAGVLAWQSGLGGGAMIMSAAIGGLLPDLDLPTRVDSPLERWSVRLFRKAGAAWIGHIFAAFIRLFRLALHALGASHRGWWHSPYIPFSLMALGVIFRGVTGELLFGMGLGILAHLLADSLTPSGIRWFRWHLRGPIRTGSPLEAAVVMAVLLVAGIVLACAR